MFKPSGLAQVTARGLKDGAWIVPGESALHCARALCTSPRRRGHGHGDGDGDRDRGGSPAAAVGKWGSTGFAATDSNRLDPRSLRGVAAGAYGGAGTARGANRCRGALRSALLRGCQCAVTAPTRASSSGAAAHKREEDAEDTRRDSGVNENSPVVMCVCLSDPRRSLQSNSVRAAPDSAPRVRPSVRTRRRRRNGVTRHELCKWLLFGSPQ